MAPGGVDLGIPTPSVPSGTWVMPAGVGSGASGTFSLTSYFVPIDLPSAQSFDRIGCNLQTAGTGAGLAGRLGVYGDNGAKSKPLGAPLVDAGTVDLTGATGDLPLTIALALGVGRFWLCIALQGALTLAPQLCVQNSLALAGASNLQPNTRYSALSFGAIAGALPTLAAASAVVPTQGQPPLLGLRAA